jgi:tetratricopeptide (TPR) repeat protein
VRAWKAVGARSVASRFDAQHDGSLTPLVGREESHEQLKELWRRARAGVGQVVLISGEGGVGKSRLAAQVLEDTSREERVSLRYFCSEYRRGSPLHPCIQQLEHAAGFSRDDTGFAAFAKLESVMAGAPETDLALIAELLNLPPSGRWQPQQLGPRAKRQRTLQVLLDQLERVSRRAPALVVFEDAQWSDDTTAELLGRAVELIAGLPVLLLVLARPDFHPAWAGRPHVSCIALGPLERKASAELVNAVAWQRPLPRQVVDQIVSRSDGLPLYLEELTRAIADTQDRRAAVRAYGPRKAKLTDRLHAVLSSRLDGLGGAWEIVEKASAIGRDFTSDLLVLVVDLERDEELQTLLDRLVQSGLVRKHTESRGGYSFKHALIRDAAYYRMTEESRREAHVRIAEALRAHYPETEKNNPEILAWHFTESLPPEEPVAPESTPLKSALQCWLAAGNVALRRSAPAEALRHLRRGRELVTGPGVEDTSWRRRWDLDFTIPIGQAQILSQGYAVASTRDTFVRARELCGQLGNPPELLAVMHGLWTHALLRADFPTARGHAEQVLARGESGNDPGRLWSLMGHRFAGVTSHPAGEFEAASRLLALGLDLYDPAMEGLYAKCSPDDPRVVMLTYRSWSLMCLGEFGAARDCVEKAVGHARQLTRPMAPVYTLAHALNGAAFVALTIDTPGVALDRLDELAQVLADNGMVYYEAVERIFRGYCRAKLGEYDAAVPLLVSGLDAYRATSSVLYLSGFLRMSAEAHGWAGRHDTAMDLIREATAIMESTGQLWDKAEILRVHGRLLHAGGDRGAAEKLFREACAVARTQGARLWELRAACELADLLREGGSPGAARAALKRVVGTFEDGEAVIDLRRARAMLEAATAGESA